MAGACLAVVAVLGLAVIIVSIRAGLQRFSDQAVARFPGDRNTALIRVVECTTCLMEDRNHAVWALGQTVVAPALPVLKKHYDGNTCTHESRLCQKELRKAIHMIETRVERAGGLWESIARLHQPWN